MVNGASPCLALYEAAAAPWGNSFQVRHTRDSRSLEVPPYQSRRRAGHARKHDTRALGQSPAAAVVLLVVFLAGCACVDSRGQKVWRELRLCLQKRTGEDGTEHCAQRERNKAMRCVQRVCFSPVWTAAIRKCCEKISVCVSGGEQAKTDPNKGSTHARSPPAKTQESTPKPVRAQ